MADYKSSDLYSILAGQGTCILKDKKKKEVKVTDAAQLQGKVVALYQSASWCPPCRSYTPRLSALYKALRADGKDFEVVWVSGDRDLRGFKSYYKKMPWTAVPFELAQSEVAQRCNKALGSSMPNVTLFNGEGKLYCPNARNRMRQQGAAGFPWTEAVVIPEVLPDVSPDAAFAVSKTEEEWKAELTPEEYAVLRGKGTEASGKGKYTNQLPTKGHYKCRGCNTPLYSAQSKFDSGCGWPAFDACYKGALKTNTDTSYGMTRVEIVCARCNGHLGHVFTGEGHSDTDERHCVNSICVVYDDKEPEGDLTEEIITAPLIAANKQKEAEEAKEAE